MEEVVAEVDGLARAGYRQVTLLGQNVNAYGKRFPDGSGYRGPAGRRELLRSDDGAARLADFPALLHALDARTSIDRIKFTTSHPFDAHDELFRAMAACRAVCEFLHLPVQSGSDGVLRAMRRGYTVAGYLDKVARLRALVPEVALTTDIIVGFPGETEADFEATRALMAEVQYDSAFVFKYSPRPGTAAAGLPDDVPRAVKEARNQALLALQGAISVEKLGRLVGREVEMLVEGRNRRGQLTGHTRANATVVCDGPDDWIGELVPVRVTRATPTTLIGNGPA
jgi:tRNA-2-methylthio-N6-dimethylallyladenosine synthase